MQSIAKWDLVTECIASGLIPRIPKQKGELGIMAPPGLRQVIPLPHDALKAWRKEMKMHDIQLAEHYTDMQEFAAMTRMKVVNYVQLVRIACHLSRNAEDLAASTDAPCVENYRVAGAMLGWAYNLMPLRIESRFDY
jgi:hypothetical protein